jgi:hypothetical protein
VADQRIPVSTCALILGRRRQGKSTLALSIAARYHTDILIFDPNAQFKGFRTFEDVEEFRAWWTKEQVHGISVYRPQIGEVEECFEDFISVLRDDKGHALYGNLALIVDEASELQSSYAVNETLDWCLRRSPRDETTPAGQVADWSVIQTTHRWPDANNLTKSQVTDVFMFQTTLSRDLKVVADTYGQDIAQILPRLKRHEVLHWWLDDGRAKYAVWRNPAEWYISIDGGRIDSRGIAA